MKKSANRIVASLLITIGFIFAAHDAHADASGRLAVTITGSYKKDVAVEVSGGDTPVEQVTPKNGKTTFVLAPGIYTVTPRKAGIIFTPESWRVGIVSGQTLPMRISSSKMKTNVGMAYCMSCHDEFLSDSYADWLKGPHGNFDGINSTGILMDYNHFLVSLTYPTSYSLFPGFPSSAEITNYGQAASYCLSCHGPWAEDNRRAAGFPLVRSDGTVDTINTTQLSRPVVGCESCHGSGRRHIANPFGRALTYDNPSAVQCGQCHNKNFPTDHVVSRPMGAGGEGNPGIYEAYQASMHPLSVNDHVLDSAGNVRATCSKCHTDQGGRLFKDVDGTRDQIRAVLNSQAALSEHDAVQCRTCHNAHNPNELLEVATAATSTAKARSAEFNTCTNCHQLLDANDALASPYHTTHTQSIRTKHYDDPATQTIEGYNVTQGKETACSDCHNPHATNLEANEQWAESGHGEVTGLAWHEYNWKGTDRQACQKCHTTTGYVNYVANPSGYNPANNNFSHLTNLQLETLYCNGCHSNSAFDRRAISTVTFPSGRTASLGDDSNLCMVCHQGRESKTSVDQVISKTPPFGSGTENGVNKGFRNIHYLAAAATLFGTEVQGGYEYPGKTYVARNTFPGHGGHLDTCVKCHMRVDSSHGLDHRFMPEVQDCASCHTGITDFTQLRPSGTPDYDGDGNVTEGLPGELDTIRDALYARIQLYSRTVNPYRTSGVPAIAYNGGRHPYWFNDANANGVVDSNESTAYNRYDAKLYTAAYNYHTSIKDPGAFIHNHRYMLQMLYDSVQDIGGDVSHYIRP